jgi:small-conductance mechanosensitive channel
LMTTYHITKYIMANINEAYDTLVVQQAKEIEFLKKKNERLEEKVITARLQQARLQDTLVDQQAKEIEFLKKKNERLEEKVITALKIEKENEKLKKKESPKETITISIEEYNEQKEQLRSQKALVDQMTEQYEIFSTYCEIIDDHGDAWEDWILQSGYHRNDDGEIVENIEEDDEDSE